MKIDRKELSDRIAEMKKSGFNYLVKITAVDYGNYLEAVYILRDVDNAKDEILELDLPASDPRIETIMHHFKAADWYERELSEMFGIRIVGRNAEKLLLEKWDGKEYPLRKSFAWNAPYEKM